tara:strand:+ start:704 stop:1270 length:567 start_codon:yes stop_codon:yes gene_type:complete
MKLVFGVGINDADYKTHPTIDGKQVVCPFYRRWCDMLRRGYSEKFQERCPTYKGCSVAEEWLTFSNFRKWMVEQDWKGNDLDKDLLVEGNKTYSPETCVFICGELNKLLTDSAASRGELPIGVTENKDKYEARVKKNGIKVYLGTFKTPEEAHAAWKKAKAQIVLNSLDLTSDIRVKNALRSRAQALA